MAQTAFARPVRATVTGPAVGRTALTTMMISVTTIA